MRLLAVLLAGLLALTARPAAAQLAADTSFSWRGYARTATCRVRVIDVPAEPDERPHVVVLTELATNEGPSIVADARYLAERVGRRFGVDPARAYWVFHWGAFSYAGAAPSPDKELFLRATFRRTQSGALGSPYWRVVSADEVRTLTDRHFPE